MTVLGIDTSGILGGVGLCRDGHLLGEVRCDARAAASERILPQITRLLEDLDISPNELDRLGVAVGPGSFTGLRVGLASARGLSLGLDLPVVGVSSLQARSFALRAMHRPVLVVTNHRRGQVFCGAGFWSEDGFVELLAEASRDLPQAAQWVAEALAASRARCAPPLLCTGDAAAATLEAWMSGKASEGAGELICVPGDPGALPGAVALIAGAAAEGETRVGEALDDLLPRYLRGSDARLPPERKGGRRGAST